MKKLLLLCLLVSLFISAKAGIITVTNTNDAGAGSLRQAVVDALSGDTINFDPTLIAAGNDTIVLASQIVFAKNLTFNGLYNATDSLFISGKNSGRIFSVSGAGLNINLNSMIFIESGIGAVLSVSSVTAKKCIFKNNISTATYSGNAINISGSASSLIIDSCVFIRNVSNGNRGGALYSINSVNISVTNSDFKNNKATGDGGTAYFFDPSGSFIFDNNVIENDTSVSGNGGSLYVRNGINIPVFSFRNNQFSGCRGQIGGGLYLSGHSSSIRTMSKCTFEGNYSSNNGGAFYVQTMNTLNVDSCIVNNNYATNWGGGFQAGVTNLNLSHSSVHNNIANQNDGGISTSSNFTITNSSIYNNHANNARGGFSGSNVTITNSTIVKNTTNGPHGVGTASNLTITNSTIAYNSSATGQGGINASTKNIKNSIIALNTSSDPAPNINGPVNSLGYNIFEQAITGSVASDIVGVDSMAINLDTLKDNGGFAKTMVPLIPSAAIDAGDPSDLSDAQNRPVYNVVREIGAAESCATSSLAKVKACDSYTWTAGDGYTYTNDTIAYYTLAIPNADGCDSVLILELTVNASPVDMAISVDVTTHCDSGVSMIELDSTEANYKYYLRDNSNDAVVLGPIQGTGDSVLLPTGVINSSMSYNVLAMSDDAEFGVRLPLANDYINYSSPYNTYNKTMTIESWVYADTGGAVDLWAGQSSPLVDNMTTNVWLWHQNTFYVNDATTWRAATIPALDTGWTHVATVADSTGIYVYFNGVLQDSTSVGISTNIVNNPSSVIQLGHDPRFAPGTPNRNGDIGFSNFRVWNTARTQQEIADNMTKQLTGLETGLVQATRFYEGSGDTLASLVGPTGYVMNSNPTNWLLKDTGCMTEMSTITSITVNSSSTASFTQTVCDSLVSPSGNYTWTSTGVYMDTIMNAAGCDSVMTFNLTVNYASAASFTQTVCDSLVSPSGNYTWTSTGVYMDTILNASGCDSVMTFNLTVNYATSATITQTVCDSLVSPSGNYTWTSSGTYMDTIMNASSCDSVMTFNLTVNSTVYYFDAVSFCKGDSTLVAGTWIYNDTIIEDTLVSSSFCDSIVTYTVTELSITPSLDLGSDITICNNDTATIYAGVYDSYLWSTGATTSFLTVDANTTGVGTFTYWAEVGDTNLGCTERDSILIDVVQCVGIEEAIANSLITIYPNPVMEQTFTINFGAYEDDCVIEVLDVTGKVISKRTRQNKSILEMGIEGEKGVYFIKFISPSNKIAVTKIVKQ